MSLQSRLGLASLLLTFGVLAVPQAMATQAQPVPVPEDPSTAPQINISGTGIGTLDFGKTSEHKSAKGEVGFSDSSFQIGAGQKLYEGGVGSFGFGEVTTEETGRGSTLFIHQAFVDYQNTNFEAIIGRSDNPSAHLVDFPTLRGDDLITFTNPLNPFSKGEIVEEHRYANIASVTFNQQLKFFENIHVQHLINNIDPTSDTGLNSFGGLVSYMGSPGMESFNRILSWGIGYEHLTVHTNSSALHQIYTGGVINLKKSATNRIEFSIQDIYSWGSSLKSFGNATDSFQADSNALAASIRYLHSPFGRPSYQLALTTGYKTYTRVTDASSVGFALTAARRLGQGFDAVAQYQGQHRDSALASAQSSGLEFEQVAQVGFAFGFDAVFNEHLAPRRSLLNQQHGFIE